MVQMKINVQAQNKPLHDFGRWATDDGLMNAAD